MPILFLTSLALEKAYWPEPSHLNDMKQDMASASAEQDKNLAIFLLLSVCFILEHGKSQN